MPGAEGLRPFLAHVDTVGGALVPPRKQATEPSTPAIQPREPVINRGESDRFVVNPTPIPGVEVLGEPGHKVRISLRTARIVLAAARNIFESRRIIKVAKDVEKEARKTLIPWARLKNGRGINSSAEGDNFHLTIAPEVRYDFDLLRESLGHFYSDVVHEERTIVVPVRDFDTSRGKLSGEILVAAVKGTVSGMVSADLVQDEVKRTVDAEALERILKRRGVKLLPGARRVSKWQIKVDLLDKTNGKSLEEDDDQPQSN